MIKLQALSCAALYALALIPLPHEEPDVLGNWLARHGFQLFHVFERFHLSPHSLVLSLLAKHMVFNPKDDGVVVWFHRFDLNNLASINPYLNIFASINVLSSDLLGL
jgi:hypothetical protein